MGRMPIELRQIIAANIRSERLKKYPGRGGGKRCAEAFGVSPQQWSPWERGMRTPDECRLRQLADFFGVTVEYMRHDHSAPANAPGSIPPVPNESHYRESSLHNLACTENEIVWQLHKIFSGLANDGSLFHISMNIVLSKEAKQETGIRPK